MRKDYQKPSSAVIEISMQRQLLRSSGVSGRFGGNATKPAKGRRRGHSDDDDEWDEEEEWNSVYY